MAAYAAIAGELDPAFLLRRARADGKRVYLPRIPVQHAGNLQFFAWDPDAGMQPNRLGIPEPPAIEAARIAPEKLDLVLTPLLAFDERGMRLGMGGGYYDRSFAFLRTGARAPVLLGLAYEFQRVTSIPSAPWDVPLAGVVTECRSYLFNQEPSAS